MEDILAIVLIFGGGSAIALSFSPVGRAFADRIRGRHSAPVPDPAVYEELDQLRQDVTELQERVDFTERLLAKAREERPEFTERLPARDKDPSRIEGD